MQARRAGAMGWALKRTSKRLPSAGSLVYQSTTRSKMSFSFGRFASATYGAGALASASLPAEPAGFASASSALTLAPLAPTPPPPPPPLVGAEPFGCALLVCRLRQSSNADCRDGFGTSLRDHGSLKFSHTGVRGCKTSFEKTSRYRSDLASIAASSSSFEPAFAI